LPDDLTVNVGTLAGGTGVTAIASEAVAMIEARAPANATVDRFVELVSRTKAGGPLAVSVELLGRRPGGVLAETHYLFTAAQRARARVGLPPAASGASSSDANPFISYGIPALCIGITTGRHAHQLDEEIDVAPIVGGVRALAALVLELAGTA
jgi:acetylornithine deacetylase/succinyl-diaminopimelate desuccinylase-like protein